MRRLAIFHAAAAGQLLEALLSRAAILLAAATILLSTPALASSPEVAPAAATRITEALLAKVNAAIDADAERLTAIFKDLHQHPETGFTETRTAGIVAKELKALGFTVTEGIGTTGVVGVFKNGSGPTVWFRADMDANPGVLETTGLPYAAPAKQRLADGTEIDVMHACGHDAHVTWMLGLAKAMVALKDDWSGTLVVYGQPAEELIQGAQAMVEDGLWKRGFPLPDFAFGAHTAPIPVGLIVSSPGVRQAGTDQLDVTFHGLGGHGSAPQTTVDPVVMAAQAILAYQTIVSRNVDPQTPAVLSVGSVIAGRENNVIPASALLKLNLRWFKPEIRAQLLERIDQINSGVAIAAGADPDKMPTKVMKGNAGPVVNNAALVARINPSLEALVGEGKVLDHFPAVMGSEDFQEAFKGMDVPYVYLVVGAAPPALFAKAQAAGKVVPYSNHSSDFFVDLAAIPIGAKVNTVTVLSILAKNR